MVAWHFFQVLAFTAFRSVILISLSFKNTKFLFATTCMRYELFCCVLYHFYLLSYFSADIKVMECLSRTFEVKTVPLQVPYLGPDVCLHSCDLFSLFCSFSFVNHKHERWNISSLVSRLSLLFADSWSHNSVARDITNYRWFTFCP